MTFALILGGAAALYCLWTLFRLAVFALPVCAGIAAGFAALEHGYSYPVSIGVGLGLGAMILIAARLMMAANIAPAFKAAAALAFASPAALAGYKATEAVLDLAGADGALQLILSAAGATATAAASWRGLAGTIPTGPQTPAKARNGSL